MKLSEAKSRMIEAVESADLHHGIDQRPPWFDKDTFVAAVEALPDRTLLEQLGAEMRQMIEQTLDNVDDPD